MRASARTPHLAYRRKRTKESENAKLMRPDAKRKKVLLGFGAEPRQGERRAVQKHRALENDAREETRRER